MARRTYEQLLNDFRVFHAANPQVYERIKEHVYALIARGFPRYEINSIWGAIRLHYDLNTVSNVVRFKMPNNHRAFYARMFLKDHPQFSKFFRLAYQRSKGAVPVDRHGIPLDPMMT